MLKIERSSDTVRLITTKTAMNYKYALLSYCWGGDQSGKTTKSNMSSYEVGIPDEKIPATVRDGITVTRILGLEYLWVDAFCEALYLISMERFALTAVS